MEEKHARSLHPIRKMNVRDTIKLIKNQKIGVMSDQLFHRGRYVISQRSELYYTIVLTT